MCIRPSHVHFPKMVMKLEQVEFDEKVNFENETQFLPKQYKVETVYETKPLKNKKLSKHQINILMGGITLTLLSLYTYFKY